MPAFCLPAAGRVSIKREDARVRFDLRVIGRTVRLYGEKKIPRAAAALSFYLTMSVFPLILCLYTLLGSNTGKMLQVIVFLERFLSPQTTRYLKSFLGYVSANLDPGMLAAGIMLLLSTASSAVRSLQIGIGDLQGGRRFHGLRDLLFSLVFSVVFLAAVYFAILVMLTGQTFLTYLDRFVPLVDLARAWNWLRFPILGGIEFAILWTTYAASLQRDRSYRTAPGALLATLGIVCMSWAFSMCIAASARYSLVYGSLASIILLMIWLSFCCMIIYLGAAFNVAIRECTEEKKKAEETKEQTL